MAAKRFKWLAGTCYPRRGPQLEKGKEYDVETFGESVVAYWVEQKAAAFVSEKEKKATPES